MNELPIAILQLSSKDDYQFNSNEILKSIETLDDKIQMLFLPENSLYMRTDFSKKIEGLSLESEYWQPFKDICKSKELWVHFGGVPLITKNGVENASVVLLPDGDLHHTYSKIHLFDIELNGKTAYRESDSFYAGKAASVFEYFGWKMGQSICYDLRFSELYSYYAKEEVDIILVPSAFLVKTGKAHWRTLLQARAIENQCYIVAPAQSGGHAKHQSYGHSMLIDPWGEVVLEADGETGSRILEAVISKKKIQDIRKQMPMYLHRRL